MDSDSTCIQTPHYLRQDRGSADKREAEPAGLRIGLQFAIAEGSQYLPGKCGLGAFSQMQLQKDIATAAGFQLLCRAFFNDMAVVKDSDGVSKPICLFQVLGVNRTVVPSLTRVAIMSQSPSRLRGSRPLVGSSRNNTGGRAIRLAARSRRRRIPPE